MIVVVVSIMAGCAAGMAVGVYCPSVINYVRSVVNPPAPPAA